MLLTIWLEIHVKLKSVNKMFCQCKNEQNFDSLQPNTNICPVCTWQPGALPTLSKEVLQQALLLGKALHCTINEISKFDRKSYFYPDLPMWYQITQFYQPTSTKGEVKFFLDNYTAEKTVHITEAHMECDTAKMIHVGGEALLDFNRAGTPLVEIVTNPDFTSVDEVIEYLKEIQRILRYNNISDADMEKWQMRCDVNISLRKSEKDPYGIRTETKNINSFGMIKRAIEFEQARQEKLYAEWKPIDQETRGRDDAKGESTTLRSKEDALDYRYFPEPDMPELRLDKETLDRLNSIPIDTGSNIREGDEVDHKLFGSWDVLEANKNEAIVKFNDTRFWIRKIWIPFLHIKRFKEEYWFNKEYINSLINDQSAYNYFREIQKHTNPRDKKEEKVFANLIAKWFSPISAHLKETWKTITEIPFSENKFLSFLIKANEWIIMESQLKIIMDEMLSTGKDPETIIKEKWFDAPAVDENELENICKQVLADNPAIVEQYKKWKTTVIGFFVGQAMKKTWGKANPKQLQEIFEKLLA